MKTETEINGDILRITMKIEEEHPELTKYMGEMPVRISDAHGSDIDLQNLKDYYDSLVAMLKKYDITHSDDISTHS